MDKIKEKDLLGVSIKRADRVGNNVGLGELDVDSNFSNKHTSRVDDGVDLGEFKEKRAEDTIVDVNKESFVYSPHGSYRNKLSLSAPTQSNQLLKPLFSDSETVGCGLNLIGISFNGFDDVYLLVVSKSAKKIYIGQYNLKTDILSEFKVVANTVEDIYEATLYKENKEMLYWYLLGTKIVWMLRIEKTTFLNRSGSLALEPFSNEIFPISETTNYEGGSLIVYNQFPWVVGGRIEKDKEDTARRILISGSWGFDTTNLSETVLKGKANNKFLNQKRQSPIVHICADKLICISGNAVDDENIMESFSVADCLSNAFHSQSGIGYNRVVGKSFVSPDTSAFNMDTHSPKAASCIFENSIFIFTKQLFDDKNPGYYKYNFLSQGVSSSGNSMWQFFTPEKSALPDNLKFTSAKATSIGQRIYLFLFNVVEAGNSNITILKIEPFKTY